MRWMTLLILTSATVSDMFGGKTLDRLRLSGLGLQSSFTSLSSSDSSEKVRFRLTEDTENMSEAETDCSMQTAL